jgi:hypothetical protein
MGSEAKVFQKIPLGFIKKYQNNSKNLEGARSNETKKKTF